MNNVFTAKLLQNLRSKKGEKGFTLIELLVVVIIIGVLAAVALPNLLSQVGKARETEIKNAVGTVNRAQQAYHFERQRFANNANSLGISLDNEYIDNSGAGAALNIALSGTTVSGATVSPVNAEFTNDGTRAYTGGIYFDAGNYSQIICATEVPDDQVTGAPTYDATNDTAVCNATDGGTEIR